MIAAAEVTVTLPQPAAAALYQLVLAHPADVPHELRTLIQTRLAAAALLTPREPAK